MERPEVTRSTKIKLFKALEHSIALYRAETWTVRAADSEDVDTKAHAPDLLDWQENEPLDLKESRGGGVAQHHVHQESVPLLRSHHSKRRGEPAETGHRKKS